MHVQHKVAVGAVSIAMAMAVLGAGTAMAQSNGSSPSKLAQAIASHFNLNANDVQTVINQQHQANQQARQQTLKTRLDQAVQDGKLTQDQENILMQKLQTAHQDKQTMRQARQDLRQWAQSQNLNLKSLLGNSGSIMHQ